MATADVGDLGPCLEFFLDPGERGNPVVDEVRLVTRTEEPVGTAEEARTVVTPPSPVAGLECLTSFLVTFELRYQQLEEPLHTCRLPLAGEHQRLLGRD